MQTFKNCFITKLQSAAWNISGIPTLSQGTQPLNNLLVSNSFKGENCSRVSNKNWELSWWLKRQQELKDGMAKVSVYQLVLIIEEGIPPSHWLDSQPHLFQSLHSWPSCWTHYKTHTHNIRLSVMNPCRFKPWAYMGSLEAKNAIWPTKQEKTKREHKLLIAQSKTTEREKERERRRKREERKEGE